MAVPDLQHHGGVASLMTASGARIEVLSPDLAQAFLDRHGLTDYGPGPSDLAWGAFEDAGNLIGVGVLAEVTTQRARTWIAVAPERRRLGVGGELASLIVSGAQGLGLRYLACRYRAADAAPYHLAGSLGLPLARRVDEGGTWTVIVLSRNEKGEMR